MPLLLFCGFLNGYAGILNDVDPKIKWADSILNTLTIEQKIGQLFMIAAYSNRDSRYEEELIKTILRYHIGGICFFQGGPVRQAELTNKIQEASHIPLLAGMDAEWGVSMRLDSVPALPYAITLGAVTDNRLIYNTAAEIARQFRILGMQVNFAPVGDINNNPLNPVINYRSFGEDKNNVASKAVSMMRGLKDNGILAVAKHFPGHGDTYVDSHIGLPVINHPASRIDSFELYPFRKLIDAGLEGMMVGHLQVMAYDNRPGKPASLSEILIGDILNEKMGFSGLVFSDAMNMKAVTDIYPAGEAEVMALLAGVDIVVMPRDLDAAINSVKKALDSKRIKRSQVNEKVRRILIKKFEHGLSRWQPVDINKAASLKNPAYSRVLSQVVYEHAATLIRETRGLLPFRMLDTLSFASLSIGKTRDGIFSQTLDYYAPFTHFSLSGDRDPESYSRLAEKLKSFEVIIIGIHGITQRADNSYGIKKEDVLFLTALAQRSEVIIVLFGTPYSAGYFTGFDHVLCAYQDDPMSHFAIPQVIFGAKDCSGKLPVQAGGYHAGSGMDLGSLGRLGYSFPERAGFNLNYLNFIDTIVNEAIGMKAMPGCQVLIAKDGLVVYHKSFGYHTYDNLIPVNEHSVYDLASVTKVAGTVQALMFLESWQLIDPDKKISKYLPELKNTSKEDLVLKDILTHQSGLQPYIPFWKNTIQSSRTRQNYYSASVNEVYSQAIVPGVYISKYAGDSIWSWIIRSSLREKEDQLKPYGYKYSDIGFYMMHKLVERMINQPLNEFLSQNIYEPLGLSTIGYLPYNKMSIQHIVPAAEDDYFRKITIQGYVQDEMAAIYGGVAGHAGLFSNALDLAVLMQMNLQKGYYGGSQYFSPETVNLFTAKPYIRNRRGLGWDKPNSTADNINPASGYASLSSYGHTGFTGTMVWVDPEFNLTYIFLSNRTYPDPENKKLIELDVRKRIQTVIYSALINN